MKELYLIDCLDNVISVFGSLKILEDSEPFDQIQICNFSKIVRNYLIMQNKLNEATNYTI